MPEGPENLTVHVLKELRDEIRSSREQLHAEMEDIRQDVQGLRVELRETREDLGGRIDANSQRIVETEMRTATAIVEMHGTVREVLGALRAQAGD